MCNLLDPRTFGMLLFQLLFRLLKIRLHVLNFPFQLRGVVRSSLCLSICVAHIIGLLLNLIRVSVEFVPLFSECVDPLFQLVQRTRCSLKFTI